MCIYAYNTFLLYIDVYMYVYALFLCSTQFISRQQNELTVGVVQSASIGQKDAQMSLFSLWKEIFQLPSAKRCVYMYVYSRLQSISLLPF